MTCPDCRAANDRIRDMHRRAQQAVAERDAEIEKLRAALRKQGPCAAVSKEGERCELPPDHWRHSASNPHHVTGSQFWPDSDVDPVATADRERRIRCGLVEGGWE